MMAPQTAEARWSGDFCINYDTQSGAQRWFLI